MKKRVAAPLAALLAAVMLMSGCQKNSVVHGGELPEQSAPSPTPTASPTASPEESGSQLGHWNGDIYLCDILDLQYALPEGWEHFTSEEIAATYTPEESGNIMLVARNQDGSGSIQMFWDPIPDDLLGQDDLESAILQAFIETQGTGLQPDGLECSFGEPFASRFGALDFMTLQMDTVYQGVAMRQFFSVRAVEEKMVSILISTDAGIPFEEIPGGVSAFRSCGAELEVMMGEWDESGSLYCHPVLKLQYTLPEGWRRETQEEQLAAMQDFFASEVTGQQAKDWMQQSLYLDMMRADGPGAAMVDIAAQYLGDDPLDAAQYAQNTIRQAEVSDSLIEFEIGETRPVLLGGTEFLALPLNTGYNGSWVLQWLCLRREGEWMYIVSLCGGDEAQVAELVKDFSPLPAG